MYKKATGPSDKSRPSVLTQEYNPYNENQLHILDSTLEAEEREKAKALAISDKQHKSRVIWLVIFDLLFLTVFCLMSVQSHWLHPFNFAYFGLTSMNLLYCLVVLCIVTSNKMFSSKPNCLLRFNLRTRQLQVLANALMSAALHYELKATQPFFFSALIPLATLSIVHLAHICQSKGRLRVSVMYWFAYSGYEYL